MLVFRNQKPLDSFTADLIRLERVQEQLRKDLGAESEEIIKKALAGAQLSVSDLDACHDILVDLVMNESEPTKSFTGLGGYDEFAINVMKFGGVYWIEAPEFDDIGYFSSEDEASSIAEDNYEPFISAASESKEQGDKNSQ
jgi:hypothetical protein